MRKSKLKTLGIIIICFCIIPQLSFAAGELKVGWDTTEALQSIKCGDDWMYEHMGYMTWQLLYDQYWKLGSPPGYDYEPWAITDYKTEDHKKYTFFIRKGMTFHDGKPVTAKDLAFTMKYLPKASPAWSYNFTSVEDDTFVIIDDHTLEFEMEAVIGGKYPPFYSFPIFPQHLWHQYKDNMLENENLKAIGSGPFKLKEFKSGKHIIFERFDDHWDKSPRSDKIVFQTYGSGDLKNIALKRGEIDMIGSGGISPMAIKLMEKNPNLKIIQSDGMQMIWLTFNLHNKNAISNINVRKAIAYGINKDKIIQMVYRGYAKQTNSFIYPELAEYNPNLPKYEFSLDKAKKLLDDSSYLDTDNDGIRNDPKTNKNIAFKVIVSGDSAENVKMSTIIREQLKEIGINLEVRVVDISTYLDLIYNPTYDKYEIAIGGEKPGPYSDWVWEFCRSYENGGMGWNGAYYNNAEFDNILDAFYETVDPEQRLKLSYKLQEIVSNDLPYYIFLRPDIIEPVRSDNLTGYIPYMGGIAGWMNPYTYFNVHSK